MPLVYSVYGLVLCANRPIPGLVALSAAPRVDGQVWLELMPPWLGQTLEVAEQEWFISPYQDERGEPILRVWKLAGGAYFRFLYGDGTEFVIDRCGTQVWATWPDTLTLEDTATYLLGPILGFVLRLRGVICLHASAVVVSDQAVAMLGPAGAGKSTTAAALARRGCTVLSDDVVALSDQSETFLVQPGYPRLRLWPETVNTLYGLSDALPRLTPTWDKRYLDLTQNGYKFQRQPLPLAAIYVLDERCTDPAASFVDAMPASTGLMALVANTYSTSLLDKAMRAQEFELLGRLAARVPLRRLTPHADPGYLANLCDVILDDFQALTTSAHALTEAKRDSYV